MLDSWRDGPTKAAIVDFVGRVTLDDGPDYVAPQARVAAFDNDGTLWCEKPAYVQLDFLVRRLAALADADPLLKARQPYSAAASGDLAWFGHAVTKHYQGDDSDIKVLGAGILSANSAITTEDHAARVNAFFATAQHPTLHRPYTACGYAPMVDLLRYLEAHEFTCFIVSGRRTRLHAAGHPAHVRHPSRTSRRQLSWDGVSRWQPLHHRTAGIPRRRPRQTGADLGTNRTPPSLRRRQLQRRHRDAPIHHRAGQTILVDAVATR